MNGKINKKVIMLENTDEREEDTWVFNFLVPYTYTDVYRTF